MTFRAYLASISIGFLALLLLPAGPAAAQEVRQLLEGVSEESEHSADKEIILARAQTDWAFIDYSAGTPKRIPPQVSSSFEIAVVEDD